MRFRRGDVVYAEGASAILGDVIDTDEEEGSVTVKWRETETEELEDDLKLADDQNAS